MSKSEPQAIRLTSNLDHVGVARDFVAEIAKAVPMTERQVYELELAVDEALTNVVEHACEGREDAYVELAVSHTDAQFTILITHDGASFDPGTQPDVDLKAYIAERRVGGLGLFLIKKLMDEVEYSTGDDGLSRIRLVKHHPGSAGARESQDT
ncbi:MAG: ATP-binding protein [Candidatus Sericytochromatia bacterium]|nr:ATP-binding protein [Candidatus Sericytochromatia bacterium]